MGFIFISKSQMMLGRVGKKYNGHMHKHCVTLVTLITAASLPHTRGGYLSDQNIFYTVGSTYMASVRFPYFLHRKTKPYDVYC